MRKTLILCGLLTFTTAGFTSCDDEDENNNGTVNVVTNQLTFEEVHGGCLGSPSSSELTDKMDPSLGLMYYTYNDDAKEMELSIKNIVSSCDYAPFMKLKAVGDTILYDLVFEGSNIADCLCTFDATTKVKGVGNNKVYYIRPLNSYDADNLKKIDLSKETEGGVAFY